MEPSVNVAPSTSPAATTTPKRGGWHGIDFHVLMTLLFRGWSILGGAITLLVVPIWLSPVEQGYYYTFASILGLHIFFELGLSQVVVQLVGHEVAHLEVGDRKLEGDRVRIDRVASLVQLLRRWYAVAAVLFGILGGLAGAYFFQHRAQLPLAAWLPVWVVLAIATSVNLAYTPALALLEGTGRVGNVARLRLVQSVLGYGGLWLTLVCGGHLWAAATTSVASAITTAYWVRNEGALYQWLKHLKFLPANQIDWRREMLPFQWRIAASWISGYFIFYAFTPLIFSHRGAAEAGRFGMAMTVFNSVSSVGMSWINAKAPTFGMLISRGQRLELNTLFVGVFKRSMIFTAAASLAVIMGTYLLSVTGWAFMSRIADIGVIACLGIVCIVNCIVFSVATFMRAHREEPMLPVSVAAGIGTAAIAYWGSMHSILLMSFFYLALNLFMVLPWSALLFRRYFRRTA